MKETDELKRAERRLATSKMAAQIKAVPHSYHHPTPLSSAPTAAGDRLHSQRAQRGEAVSL